MGDRYILQIECPKCDLFDDEVYFAPTCGIDKWRCINCKHTVDLYEYTGISYEDASNADLIKDLCEEFENERN
jgi:transposase-like protein